jgi:hypothetical protein
MTLNPRPICCNLHDSTTKFIKRVKKCFKNEMHAYYKKTKKHFDFGFYYGNSLLVKVVAKA